MPLYSVYNIAKKYFYRSYKVRTSATTGVPSSKQWMVLVVTFPYLYVYWSKKFWMSAYVEEEALCCRIEVEQEWTQNLMLFRKRSQYRVLWCRSAYPCYSVKWKTPSGIKGYSIWSHVVQYRGFRRWRCSTAWGMLVVEYATCRGNAEVYEDSGHKKRKKHCMI